MFERALMENELDEFDFMLAMDLGKTLDELSSISNREHLAWRAFYVYRKAMSDMQSKAGA